MSAGRASRPHGEELGTGPHGAAARLTLWHVLHGSQYHSTDDLTKLDRPDSQRVTISFERVRDLTEAGSAKTSEFYPSKFEILPLESGRAKTLPLEFETQAF